MCQDRKAGGHHTGGKGGDGRGCTEEEGHNSVSGVYKFVHNVRHIFYILYIVACQGGGVSSKTRRRGADKIRSLDPLVRSKGGHA